MQKTITLTFEDTGSARDLFGPREKNLRYMMTKTGVDSAPRVLAREPQTVQAYEQFSKIQKRVGEQS